MAALRDGNNRIVNYVGAQRSIPGPLPPFLKKHAVAGATSTGATATGGPGNPEINRGGGQEMNSSVDPVAVKVGDGGEDTGKREARKKECEDGASNGGADGPDGRRSAKGIGLPTAVRDASASGVRAAAVPARVAGLVEKSNRSEGTCAPKRDAAGDNSATEAAAATETVTETETPKGGLPGEARVGMVKDESLMQP